MTDDIPLLPRGVYRAPLLGPNGERILYAVQANHRLIAREQGGVIYVPIGDNPFTANAQLWELLDRVDPPVQAQSVAAHVVAMIALNALGGLMG